MNMQVVLGDLVGQQHGVFTALGAAGVVRTLQDPAVDHEMGDVNVLRLQFAGQRLGQTAQAELAHREGR